MRSACVGCRNFGLSAVEIYVVSISTAFGGCSGFVGFLGLSVEKFAHLGILRSFESGRDRWIPPVP